MCGICGKINFNSEAVNKELINRMMDTLIHRGPDDEGIYVKDNIGLGHRRLSIIDLSTGGQPISNEDETIFIVLNGEIYNYIELRKELQQKGHKFKTQSDTESILHLYEEYGTECIKKLRGMFAFAIWDEKKQRLFLGRDRLGQKPLLYYLSSETLVFGSEAKAIVEDKSIERKTNYEAIHYFFTYLYIPAPLSAFSNIKKIPPAHYLLYENGKVTIEKYWQLSFSKKLTCSENEICEQHWQLLNESVKMRLISDVPLGAFLSGGVDSSGIVGIMSSMMNEPVKTFSIGYEDDIYNELPYAKQIAKHFNTDHHEYIVKPDIFSLLPELIWYYNEPFGDASSIPTYYVSKMARQNVKVALSGDGADENYAGYTRYLTSIFVSYYQKLPRLLRQKVIANVIGLLPNLSYKQNIIGQLKVFIKGASLPQEKRFTHRNSVFTEDFKKEIYTDDLISKTNSFDVAEMILKLFRDSDATNLLDRILYVDIHNFLPDDMLVKVDIASMVNSLELRSPFLDHKLIEFVASIPANLKIKGLTKKYILKKTFSKIIPEDWLNRKKMGFRVPTSTWFRNELKEYIYEVLLDPETISRGFFKKEKIEKLLNEHVSCKYDHDLRIWALLNFELWQRMFL